MKDDKYKVWDEMQERWVDDFHIEPNGEIWTQAFEDTWQMTSGVLVEAIGITDNNFKIIYDGDIIKVYGHSKYDSEELVFDIAEIFWNDKMMSWYCKIRLGINGSTSFPLNEYYNLTEYLEVIGNKFENKELLEEENEF